MLVGVGSKAAAKLEAAQIGFSMAWLQTELEIIGVKVSSGVVDQPKTAEETLTGALNRKVATKLLLPGADYWVGMEGGLYQVLGRDFECGWIVIEDRDGREGIAATTGFQMPPLLMRHLIAGKDLTQAIETETEITDIHAIGGFFGYQTNGHVTRTHAYSTATLVALARMMHPEFWD